jgi:5-methylcytosine-specific restriction protein A
VAKNDKLKVFVEIDPISLLPIKILKSGEAWSLPPEIVAQWPRSTAIGEIRRQVFERDRYECRRCGKRLTDKTGHMDEIKSRGEGGVISLSNSWLLCYDCHEGDKPTSEHGNRRLMFSKSEEENV